MYAGKSALPYELGVHILTGNLVWIQGPYPASMHTNIQIFNKVLMCLLDPGEPVEVNEGYRGHTGKVKCPGYDANPVEKRAMQGRVRAQHETLKGRMKNWGILSKVFCHHISLHGNVFQAYTVVTQLTIKNNELLFEVEYQD